MPYYYSSFRLGILSKAAESEMRREGERKIESRRNRTGFVRIFDESKEFYDFS